MDLQYLPIKANGNIVSSFELAHGGKTDYKTLFRFFKLDLLMYMAEDEFKVQGGLLDAHNVTASTLTARISCPPKNILNNFRLASSKSRYLFVISSSPSLSLECKILYSYHCHASSVLARENFLQGVIRNGIQLTVGLTMSIVASSGWRARITKQNTRSLYREHKRKYRALRAWQSHSSWQQWYRLYQREFYRWRGTTTRLLTIVSPFIFALHHHPTHRHYHITGTTVVTSIHHIIDVVVVVVIIGSPHHHFGVTPSSNTSDRFPRGLKSADQIIFNVKAKTQPYPPIIYNTLVLVLRYCTWLIFAVSSSLDSRLGVPVLVIMMSSNESEHHIIPPATTPQTIIFLMREVPKR